MTVARNIILYTLIVDDENSLHVEQIWNIYNDPYLDLDSLTLLRRQAKTLKNIANVVEEWHGGKYGKLVRFGDSGTFTNVQRVWEFYSLLPSDGHAFQKQQQILRLRMRKAQEIQKKVVGQKTILTGLRSAAPCSISGIEDIPRMYQHYWETMTTALTTQTDMSKKQLNPMFGTLHDNLILHYGTEPFLGFHLATAYAPLSQNSPLKHQFAESPKLRNVLSAALTQFRAWAEAFRATKTRITIRFVNADALAFCHVLQHLQTNGESETAYWYRDNWHYEPLILDSSDYTQQGTFKSGPLQFDIIDTSNLVDHLGCLNLLAATSPLLSPKATSTILTEMLVLRQGDIEEYGKGLLCGDLAAISLLFKLCPIQYWTQATAISSFGEEIVKFLGKETEDKGSGQSRCIVTWKSACIETMHGDGSRKYVQGDTASFTFDAEGLAKLMFRVYIEMFQDENWGNILGKSLDSMLRKPYEHYSRAGMAALLRLIKNSKQVEWELFIEHFCNLLLSDNSLNMGAHYLQELFLHLHLMGLYTIESYEPNLDGLISNLGGSPLRAWKNIPSVLCLTLVVPRMRMATFQDASLRDGSPICHIMLQSSTDSRQNIFPDVQLGFGNVVTSGKEYTDDFSIQVRGDNADWEGHAPLVVSVIVPTWAVLLDTDLSTEVLFALKSTPLSMAIYAKRFGFFLTIHKSILANKDVFITRHRPNMSGHISICSGRTGVTPVSGETIKSKSTDKKLESQLGQTKTSFQVSVDQKSLTLALLTIRLDILSTEDQQLLKSGVKIIVKQPSPFTVGIEVGPRGFGPISLPVPIEMTNGKTRIARKSSYVEFIATISTPKLLYSCPDCLFPIVLCEAQPVLRNLHYVNLDRLPLLNVKDQTKLQWLTTHLSSMFSAKERQDRGKSVSSKADCQNLRANFKDSLYILFMQFAGLQIDKIYTVFGINHPNAGGCHMLIFCSGLRLDIANQSVVLDAAVIPLSTELIPKLNSLLRSVQNRGISSINVDDNELLLWKNVLPAFVERCRDWPHSPSCEYKAENKIPLSVELGAQVLCSCGEGRFPSDYKVEDKALWKNIRKHAVRVAIPPCFIIPFMEKAFDPSRFNTSATVQQTMGDLENLRMKVGQCAICQRKEGIGGGALRKCGRCRSVEYCSTECQTKDWKKGNHKDVCKTLRRAG